MTVQDIDKTRLAAIVIVCATVLCLSNCGGPPAPTPEEAWQAALPDRPSTYGLTLPEPVNIPEYVADSTVAPETVEQLVQFTLWIDARGRVTDLKAEKPEHFLYAACYNEYLRGIAFKPGFRDTVRVPMRLPVTMQIGALGDKPEVLFPVYENHRIVEYDLYARALEMNGLDLPSIEYFPSYNCDIDSFSTAPIYPYILFTVDLDSTGRPTAIEPLRSTYPKYERKLRMAANWGEYTPLVVDGVPRASRCYVLISFFPLVEYPTVPLDSAALDTLPLMQRLRVRIFADTLGLMAKPIPAGFWWQAVRTEREWHRDFDLFSTRWEIDSLGQANHVKTTGRNSRNQPLAMKLSREIYFYPALDFQGRPQAYRGMLYLERPPKQPVRMWITWLPESRLESSF